MSLIWKTMEDYNSSQGCQSPTPLICSPTDVKYNGGALWNLWEHEGQIDPVTLEGKLHLREVVDSTKKLESVLKFHNVNCPSFSAFYSYCFMKQDINLCTLTGHPLKLKGSIIVLHIHHALGTGFQVHNLWKNLLRDVIDPPVHWNACLKGIEGITVLRAGHNSNHKIFIWVDGTKVDLRHFPQLITTYLGQLLFASGIPFLKDTLESHSYNSDISQIEL